MQYIPLQENIDDAIVMVLIIEKGIGHDKAVLIEEKEHVDDLKRQLASDLVRLEQVVTEAVMMCDMVTGYVEAIALRTKRTERVNAVTTKYVALISHEFANPHDDEDDHTEYVLPQQKEKIQKYTLNLLSTSDERYKQRMSC